MLIPIFLAFSEIIAYSSSDMYNITFLDNIYMTILELYINIAVSKRYYMHIKCTMVKKVTLYLGDDLFSSIQKLRAFYLFGGSHVSDLPDVSDVIEACIYYERFYLEKDPEEATILKRYESEENPLESLIKQGSKIKSKGAGRLLFAIRENTQLDLDFIRDLWKYKGTDPLLIRDLLDRVFNEYNKKDIPDWANLFLRTYIGHLYKLKLREALILSLCSSGKLPIETLTTSLTVDALDIIREIALDEGKIERLEAIIGDGQVKMKTSGIFSIKWQDFNEYRILLYNKEYTFNFIDSYWGFAFVMKDLIKTGTTTPTPPSFVFFLIGMMLDPTEHKYVKQLFFRELKGALKTSIQFNKHL